MQTLKPKPEPKEECSHINTDIIDSGMALCGETRRDIGLGCKDCGLEWDIHLYAGSSKATIRLRQSGAKEHDSNITLLESFIDYLREHKMDICYYDSERKKRQDIATKSHYPISYNKNSIRKRIDLFFEELRRNAK